MDIPANTKHEHKIYTMLGQRRRHSPHLYKCFVLAGIAVITSGGGRPIAQNVTAIPRKMQSKTEPIALIRKNANVRNGMPSILNVFRPIFEQASWQGKYLNQVVE